MTAALVAVPLITASTASAAPPAGPQQLEIVTVSNPRPQLVSGGQVLVQVTLPAGADFSQVRITENARSVRSAFRRQPDGTLLGLVTGLRDGSNRLVARTVGHGAGAGQERSLEVVNHPASGPVFSGPQQLPFYCQTEAFGLAPAVQPLCYAPTQVTYQYRTTAGAFAPLADPAARPADLATTTVGARTVPYVVRLERGTIDRAVYEIAALYDGREPSPLGRDRNWNEKLVYTFGGGCNAGYHQGAATGGVLNDLFLRQGYAVASSTLNVLDNNCSPIISAEAAMMVKEHVIETYGPVQHTIGWGGSGGAIQQYTIADAYPGIVDGIIPGVSFPDPLTTIGPVTDCRLLDTYFAGSGVAFTDAQKQAIAGFRSYDTCTSWDATFASRATATDSCNPAIPVAVRYDPVTNPGGVKCGSLEQLVNQLGRDPQTGFVRSPLDNTGVQYGLAALQAGQITPAQFTDLNQQVGGLDVAGKVVAQRAVADPEALRTVYADDLINSASLGLRSTPIIDQRTDLDLAGFGSDIHTTEWSFVMRDRLRTANGTAANQVIIETSFDPATTAAAAAYELDAMDRWLTAIDADGSNISDQRKVLFNKPTDLGDGCYVSATERIRETLNYPTSGRCGELFPVAGNTRLAAGEHLNMLVQKCHLTPLNFKAYPVTFTAAQKAQLRATFANGVCDYARQGDGQRPPIGTWLSYGDERTGLTPPTPIPGAEPSVRPTQPAAPAV